MDKSFHLAEPQFPHLFWMREQGTGWGGGGQRRKGEEVEDGGGKEREEAAFQEDGAHWGWGRGDPERGAGRIRPLDGFMDIAFSSFLGCRYCRPPGGLTPPEPTQGYNNEAQVLSAGSHTRLREDAGLPASEASEAGGRRPRGGGRSSQPHPARRGTGGVALLRPIRSHSLGPPF